MRPNYLFHGSRQKISGGFLEPRYADDVANPENRQFAVFATPRWEIAAGFSLIGEPGNSAWVRFTDVPFKVIFVAGEPSAGTKRYIYKVAADNFEPLNGDASQWVARVAVPIVEIEERFTEELSDLWRKASCAEIVEFKRNIKD